MEDLNECTAKSIFSQLWPSGQYEWETEKDHFADTLKRYGPELFKEAAYQLETSRRRKKIEHEMPYFLGIVKNLQATGGRQNKRISRGGEKDERYGEQFKSLVEQAQRQSPDTKEDRERRELECKPTPPENLEGEAKEEWQHEQAMDRMARLERISTDRLLGKYPASWPSEDIVADKIAVALGNTHEPDRSRLRTQIRRHLAFLGTGMLERPLNELIDLCGTRFTSSASHVPVLPTSFVPVQEIPPVKASVCDESGVENDESDLPF